MDNGMYEKIEHALLEVKHGNVSGVEKLYEILGKRMLFVARSIVKDFHFAEDVVQESFLKIVKNISSYKSGTNGCAWILMIVRNTAINHLKSDKLKGTVSLDEFEFLSGESFSEKTENALLAEKLLSLISAEERALVYRKYFLDMNVREIGREIGKSKSYVAKKIAEAEKKMKKNLENPWTKS